MTQHSNLGFLFQYTSNRSLLVQHVNHLIDDMFKSVTQPPLPQIIGTHSVYVNKTECNHLQIS